MPTSDDYLSFMSQMISSFQDVCKKQAEKTIQPQEDPIWGVGTECKLSARAITAIVR
jgi:hypothetical protein